MTETVKIAIGLISLLIYYHRCNGMDISTSIANNDIKIAIVNDNQISISIKNNQGPRRLIPIGNHLPLSGKPRWKSSPNRFKSTWDNGMRLTVTAKSTPENTFHRLQIRWQAPDSVPSILECLALGNDHLYGGSQMADQSWPLQNFTEFPFVPTGADGRGVLLPYFLTRSASYFVPPANPLFVSFTPNRDLCFRVAFEKPYRNTQGRPLVLIFEIGYHRPLNMTALWLATSKSYFGHPSKVPSFEAMRDPIWATWTYFKTRVNQSALTEYVSNISRYGFTASHIEIEDNWETCYGDAEFDPRKFPDPVRMVQLIKSYGYNVTLWVHPFVNIECKTFDEAAAGEYLVTANGYTEVGLTKWWQGKVAGVIDVTKTEAKDWWKQRLVNLSLHYGISGYKFDAGETDFLPPNAYLRTDEKFQPGSYATYYSDFAKYFGGQVEVRVGYYSQRQGGVFTRLYDRDSTWALQNGLKSVITATLLFGIIGYPFVLPDYVGGNAYGDWPDRELFIRCTQLNAFLPVMQFSIPPWSYDEEVVNITLKMVELHREVSGVLIEAAKQALADGSPIIRPLWWIDWNDETSQVINDEFLVGNAYLVAPIVTRGMLNRDIYVPKGNWTDMLRKKIVIGPVWLPNYTIALQDIAYFKNNF